jgi:beta-lactam-binding protein with PASTA domain
VTVTREVVCTECEKATDSSLDFCLHCGAYLAWTETVNEKLEPRPDDQPAVEERVLSQVELEVVASDGAGAGGRPLAVQVTPGASIALKVRLRNVGPVVDGYAIRVRHLPASWVTLPESTIDLMSVGHHGLFEGEATVLISVPRRHDAAAGEHSFTVLAEAIAKPGWSATTDGTLTVERFDTVVVTVAPPIVQRHRRAVFGCQVNNGGNARIAPLVHAIDEQNRCVCLVEGQTTYGLAGIPPGRPYTHRIEVSTGWRLIGAPRDHAIKVSVEIDGLEHPPPPQVVTFRQLPIIPLWVPSLLLALATLAIALVALLTLLPEQRVVPALEGRRSAFAAQRILTEAGFKKPPIVTIRIAAQPAPGSVIGQDPRKGRKVPEDTVVTVVVAGAPTTTIVPDLRRHTVDGAEGMLARAHLELGEVQPAGSLAREIKRQVPRAGSVRPRGTKVSVVAKGPGLVEVPRVKCLKVGPAEDKLQAKGFKVGTLPNYVGNDDIVRGQNPRAGARRKPGTKITLRFKPGYKCPTASGGNGGTAAPSRSRKRSTTSEPENGFATPGAPTPVPPGLTYDDGRQVLMDGTPLVPGAEPAWIRGGRDLAWRINDHDIAIRRIGAQSVPVAVLPSDPARSPRVGLASVPRGTSATLAYLENRAGAAVLCFAKLDPPAISCSTLGPFVPWDLAVSPDGRHLAVVAAPAGERRPGVLQLESEVAGSAAAGDWKIRGGLVNPERAARRGAVFDVTYSGDESAFALTTDLTPGGGRSAPRVVLAPARGLAGLTGASWTNLRACELAFEPHGARLAVVRPSSDGCPSPDQMGTLAVVTLDSSARAVRIASAARDVTWRPTQP